jgi:hypothetical protein
VSVYHEEERPAAVDPPVTGGLSERPAQNSGGGFMKFITSRLLVPLLAIALAAFTLSSAGAGKASKKIKVNQLPETVRTQYAQAFGKAPIRKCYEEDRDGRTYYRLLSKQKHGTATLIYTSGGVLEEMREPVEGADLPLPVIATVSRRFPRGKITACERITRGKTVLYAATILQLREEYREVYDSQGGVQIPARGEAK